MDQNNWLDESKKYKARGPHGPDVIWIIALYCTVMCISLIPFENPGWTADTFKTYTACHNVKGMLYTKLVLS